MPDLAKNPRRLDQLLDHMLEREGAIRHFYCDHRGLVTIGIGYLVDKSGVPDAWGRNLARALAGRAPAIRFTHIDGSGGVNAAAVVTDWQRVKDAGRRLGAAGAHRYAAVARLRMPDDSIRALLSTTVRHFIDQLYEKRPAILDLDERVAMALVDARFNPAGIPLYGHRPRLQQMWRAFDSGDPAFDPERAVDLFEDIWRHRGTARYQQRHAQRVAWLREWLWERSVGW